MAKLTDKQLIVLSKAAQRDDGAALRPDGMPMPATRKLGASLVAKKLVREVRSKAGMPVWRNDEEERPISLVILKAGREAIGLDDDAAPQIASESSAHPSSVSAGKTGIHAALGRGKDAASKKQSVARAAKMPASGSKRSHVIGMLSSPGGATLAELVAATGWLPHTARAVLTGLRKERFAVERQRPEGAAASTYRIGASTSKAG